MRHQHPDPSDLSQARRRSTAEANGTAGSIGAFSYYTQDHLGSTRNVYDDAQGLQASFDYTPYGESYFALAERVDNAARLHTEPASPGLTQTDVDRLKSVGYL